MDFKSSSIETPEASATLFASPARPSLISMTHVITSYSIHYTKLYEIQRSLFDRVGKFDETLPACEDYDLWLRISCRFPVHLIDAPLIIKRGGHDDQLSSRAGLDRFRIKAIEKIIKSGILSDDQYRAAVETLKKKCGIYAAGCRKP